jgi:hypothetical protein
VVQPLFDHAHDARPALTPRAGGILADHHEEEQVHKLAALKKAPAD